MTVNFDAQASEALLRLGFNLTQDPTMATLFNARVKVEQIDVNEPQFAITIYVADGKYLRLPMRRLALFAATAVRDPPL